MKTITKPRTQFIERVQVDQIGIGSNGIGLV